jgi:hypothetical protein
MYKPDETAEGIAIATARKENPAADANSQSIVIHPLHISNHQAHSINKDKPAGTE